MRKLLLLALSLLICLSATACVTIQTYNFGMAFAEIYATLDLDEIEPLTNGEAYESLAQALEFDRALAGLGEAEFVPLSSTAKEGGYEVRMRVNLTREGRTYSRIQTYRLTYGQWQGEQRVTAWELVGLQPFSGLPESGIRLFLEAAAEGDAARVAGLSDIWGFEAEERAELLQEICLALLDPPQIEDIRASAHAADYMGQFTLDGNFQQLLFLTRQVGEGIYFTVQQVDLDLTTPEATCRTHLGAYATFNSGGLLATMGPLSEEENDAVWERMAALKEQYAGIKRAVLFRGLDRISEEEDRVTGILHLEIRLITDSWQRRTPLSVEVELVRSGLEWKLTDSPLPEFD